MLFDAWGVCGAGGWRCLEYGDLKEYAMLCFAGHILCSCCVEEWRAACGDIG